MGELGWRGCYEPAASAERLVIAADLRARTFVCRRACYGVRFAAVGGGRPKGTAARAVAIGGAAALVGRDRARAVERWESVGRPYLSYVALDATSEDEITASAERA